MPALDVVLIDTSVLLNLLRVPGRCQNAVVVEDRFNGLVERGSKFILPIAAVIETGNFIEQCPGPARREAAQRYETAINAALGENPPWIIRDVSWGPAFLRELLAGDSTGTSLVDHFTHQSVGAGDMTILVERDHIERELSVAGVWIWTLDNGLQSYAGTPGETC